MSGPLVSVLIPAYQAAAWIGAALDSVRNQTWPHLEIIVVDGGSSDGTPELVAQSGDVTLIRQTRARQSAAANRNRAFQQCRGTFIQYLDADDVLSPNKIELQLAALRDTPGSVASAEWARFYADPSEAQFIRESVWCDLDPVEWLTRAWTGGGGMMQPGLWLIPRVVAERAGPWDERLSLIDDFEYFTRVLLASDGVRFCPGARLYYRSGNTTSLASQRSPAAWHSALLALELGTSALLSRTSDPRARSAAADVFQQLAYDAYIDAPEISAAAEQQVARLGGSRAEMGGGLLFGVLRQTIGWKRAKRVKRLAYRIGYDAHSDHSRS